MATEAARSSWKRYRKMIVGRLDDSYERDEKENNGQRWTGSCMLSKFIKKRQKASEQEKELFLQIKN